MPGNAESITNEREGLLTFLRQQRDGLRYASYGLTEQQIRARPLRSRLSIGGLMKHGALTERSWVEIMCGRGGMGGDTYVDSFAVGDDETIAGLVSLLDQVEAETEEAVDGLASLDVKVQLPPAPWFPDNPDGYQARWILLHVVEELARHAGHADIIREEIDGATMHALMAAAEGWPETEWLKPWKPGADELTAG